MAVMLNNLKCEITRIPCSGEEKDLYEQFLVFSKVSTALHSVAFLRCIETALGSEVYIIFLKDKNNTPLAAMPFALKKAAHGCIINSLPVRGSYGGILANDEIHGKKEAFEEIFRTFNTFALEKKCFSFTVMTSPFMTEKRNYLECLKPNFTISRETLLLDIRNRNYSKNVKDALRKARKFNFKVRELDEAELEKYYEIEKLNCDFLNIDCYPFSFFKSVYKYMIKDGKAVYMVATLGNKIMNGMLLMFNKDCVTYFSSCSRPESRNMQGTSFLIDHSLDRLEKEGYRIWDWKASPGDSSGGVYKYKKRWGSRGAEFHYFTKLYCEQQKIEKMGISYFKNNFQWFYIMPFEKMKEVK